MPAAIVAEGLVKRFGSRTAVAGLDLSIAPGEIYGLIGPDGAGKTTTLRMLATVARPDSGAVRVLGLDAARSAAAIRQRIGYMSQQLSLYSDLSVLENLEFHADIFAVRGALRRERINSLLEFARLTEFKDRWAGRLSGGMKRKLGLACSLVHRPEVLFLDEPTTGVDPVSRREFWDILSELHLEGVTIVVTTPYMDEAERCSRVGLIYRGRLISEGTPAGIKATREGELVELRPVGEGSASAVLRRAEAVLAGVRGVSEVQTYGDLLRLYVDDAARRMPELEEALRPLGITPEGLRRARPRMEEAFISLIQRQAAAEDLE